MDSLTQIVLGAAVGEAVAGKKMGRKAPLWGAMLGTLPDLDVLVAMGGPVKDFTYHRSWSHSIFIAALVTPLIVWLINRVHPQLKAHSVRWALMVYAVLATHPILDSFTTYGTQIFWPISSYPVSISSVFIIDPFYTVPLLFCLVGALIWRQPYRRAHILITVGLSISSSYLLWSLVAKQLVNQQIENSLASQNIEHDKVFSTPGPFNTLLWRTVVMDDDGYYQGYYSLLDGDRPIDFTFYPSRTDLLADIADDWTVQRLQWFSHGIYRVDQQNNDVIIRDLRMGMEPNYIFSFIVAEQTNPGVKGEGRTVKSVEPVILNTDFDTSMIGKSWRRISDPGVRLSP